MKSFKKLLSEVAQPKSEDELNFKDKHIVQISPHPVGFDHQHTGDTVDGVVNNRTNRTKRKAKRIADYDHGEDSAVYEGMDLDDEDLDQRYERERRMELKQKIYDEAKLDPVGQEDDDIDNDGDVDASDRYLHNRRKVIAKTMKESLEEITEKAKSEAQQKAAAIALAVKRGEKPKSELIGASKDMYKMSEKDLEDFARTKHKGIPARVNESDDAIWMVTWKQKNTGNDGREYMDSTQFHKTEREARLHKGKLKHDPRVLRNSPAMKKIKQSVLDKNALANESVELDESNQMAAIGRKLQQLAPKEKNDMIANAMANLGDHLESYGTTFGARNMKELEKKTGLTATVIQMLIKRAGATVTEDLEITEISRDLARSYIRKATADKANASMYEEVDLDESWSDGISSRTAHVHWSAATKYRRKANDSAAIAKRHEKGSPEHSKHMADYHSTMAKHIKSAYHAGQYGDMATAKKDHKAEMNKAKEYKSSMKEEVDLNESNDAAVQRSLSAHRIKQAAKVKAGIPLRRPGEGLAAYVTRKAKAQAKMQKEDVELSESIDQIKKHHVSNIAHFDNHSSPDTALSVHHQRMTRLHSDAANKAKQSGNKKLADAHSAAANAHRSANGSVSAFNRAVEKTKQTFKESVELNEAKTDIYHKHMLKALGKSRLPKDHSYTSEVSSTSGDFIVRDGGGRIVGRIPKGEHNLKESAFVAKAAYARKDDKKHFTLGKKKFPVTIKKDVADEIAEEAQPKWRVKIGTRTYTVTARNTSEANRKASVVAKREGNSGVPSGPIMRVQESTDLTENFKTGSVKLNDGSSVLLKKQDADLLNQMFKDLNAANRKKMMDVAMKDKAGFEEILSFAREAL